MSCALACGLNENKARRCIPPDLFSNFLKSFSLLIEIDLLHRGPRLVALQWDLHRGAFLDEDGTAYISYWMVWGGKGIGLSRSIDSKFERWSKFQSNPVIKATEWGLTETTDEKGFPVTLCCADPSNIWKKHGIYYMCAGNLTVLNKHGRKNDSSPDYRGDHLTLYESKDLVSWHSRGDFYHRRTDGAWTDDSEDIMCPCFLPLPASPGGGIPSGKHLLLFISHNKGCQYYIGTYDLNKDRFIPENHGRMTWVDNTFFAPEALVDGAGRQIMWAWLLDNPSKEQSRGWSGVFCMPRTLWLGEGNSLRMAPVPELEILRYCERCWENLIVENESIFTLNGIPGDACEIEIEMTLEEDCGRAGVMLRASPGMEEKTMVYYDPVESMLCFDATESGIDGRRVLEKAPLFLVAGESLKLRVFIDASVVEVFANERQAICRRVYPGRDDSLGIHLFTKGCDAKYPRVRAWEIAPSNMY